MHRIFLGASFGFDRFFRSVMSFRVVYTTLVAAICITWLGAQGKMDSGLTNFELPIGGSPKLVYQVRVPKIGSLPSEYKEKHNKNFGYSSEEMDKVTEDMPGGGRSDDASRPEVDGKDVVDGSDNDPIDDDEIQTEDAIPNEETADKASTEEGRGPSKCNAEDGRCEEERVEKVVTANGQTLLCRLPTNRSRGNRLTLLKQKRVDPTDEAQELLSRYKNKCYLFPRSNSWWRYRFCFQDKVLQEHTARGSDTATESFSLGNYDGATAQDSDEQVWTDQNEYTEMYNNGSLCDLTNEPRRTRLRYVCSGTYPDENVGIESGQDRNAAYVSAVTELETCIYEVVFVNDAICGHSWYRQNTKTESLDIECELDEGEYVFVGLASKRERRAAWM
ncbi:hypothetical protein NDN08_003938 [Rhodosorus marinus]|uniref:MRH domain-containing protein n=1 Tax=Rhodosorus marinus TaxID=101924 RepID=A0AAV8UKL9_9RHOD|nr:hypothetical protein NDN08_003938 [Rhodosorus marinus]